MNQKIYPRTGDTQTVYLNAVVQDPSIEIGDYTIYNDFVSDPRLFEQNNVLYHFRLTARVGNRAVLFHCLRCEIPFQLRQSFAQIPVILYFPTVL